MLEHTIVFLYFSAKCFMLWTDFNMHDSISINMIDRKQHKTF